MVDVLKKKGKAFETGGSSCMNSVVYGCNFLIYNFASEGEIPQGNIL